MTMKVRITNEATGTNYLTRIRVFDRTRALDEKPNDLAPDIECKPGLAVLRVGSSQEFWLTSQRYLVIEEMEPPRTVREVLERQQHIVPVRDRDYLFDIDHVAALVHQNWVNVKRAAGVTSRKAEDGEELMVPFEQLSAAQQEMDRALVRTVYAAIALLEGEP